MQPIEAFLESSRYSREEILKEIENFLHRDVPFPEDSPIRDLSLEFFGSCINYNLRTVCLYLLFYYAKKQQ